MTTTDPFACLVGKTVASVEVCDTEALVAFTDGSELAVTLETTGGDYGTPVLSAVATDRLEIKL
jgi:hypothetical protein